MTDLNPNQAVGLATKAVRTVDFDQEFAYDGPLGAFYTPQSTRFIVWAPTAKSVTVEIYESNQPDSNLASAHVMRRGERGTWVIEILGDLHLTAYTYLLDHGSLGLKRSQDPYAIAAVVNGDRSVVVNPSATQVEGFDRMPSFGKATDAIIYELNVRDFSVAEDSGISAKGKFLGLAEAGTHTSNGQITGLDYLKSLGFTHLQLLPIYDKPMIYYPLSVLMLSNIQDILIITTPEDAAGFKRLLGDGSNFGVRISYAEQPSPDGLAQAFLIGEDFIGEDDVCLVLGDNIFYGQHFSQMLHQAVENIEKDKKATIFGYYVKDPERYGVAEFDEKGNVISLEEKPKKPKSNYAVVGLYFYPNKVIDIAKKIKPSERGELEITSVNQEFLKSNNLKVQLLGRGFAWLDTGTHDSLTEASNFVETLEKRQGLKISCLEEIAFKKGWITKEKLIEVAQPLSKNAYGQYLLDLSI